MCSASCGGQSSVSGKVRQKDAAEPCHHRFVSSIWKAVCEPADQTGRTAIFSSPVSNLKKKKTKLLSFLLKRAFKWASSHVNLKKHTQQLIRFPLSTTFYCVPSFIAQYAVSLHIMSFFFSVLFSCRLCFHSVSVCILLNSPCAGLNKPCEPQRQSVLPRMDFTFEWPTEK